METDFRLCFLVYHIAGMKFNKTVVENNNLCNNVFMEYALGLLDIHY